MELFLNILWVLISVAACAIWQVCWVRQRRRGRRDPLREWTSVVCILVLLFFAVSLTDDLHSEIAMLCECSASRRSWVHAHTSTRPSKAADGVGPAILPLVASIESPRAIERTLSPTLPQFQEFSRIPSSGRSPPPSSL